MPRKKAASFKCAKCGKKFAMAMHLGRHMSTIHGQKSKTAKSKKVKKVKRRGVPKGTRVGRPPGVAGRLGLKGMTLEQLVQVIAAAKEEAGLRIAELEASIR